MCDFILNLNIFNILKYFAYKTGFTWELSHQVISEFVWPGLIKKKERKEKKIEYLCS